MQNIPVVLDGYRITVVEPPAPKTREDGSFVTNREGVRQFVVHVFAKVRPGPDGRAPKGEEIKVTLETDPGPGFDEGVRVALVDPRVSPFEIKSDNGRVTSGLSWRAMALAPAAGPAPAPAPRGEK
jgi:hypothetical protein